MTIEDGIKWYEGKRLFFEYCRINYDEESTVPTKKGYEKLSKVLDLNVSYLKKRIEFYMCN